MSNEPKLTYERFKSENPDSQGGPLYGLHINGVPLPCQVNSKFINEPCEVPTIVVEFFVDHENLKIKSSEQ